MKKVLTLILVSILLLTTSTFVFGIIAARPSVRVISRPSITVRPRISTPKTYTISPKSKPIISKTTPKVDIPKTNVPEVKTATIIPKTVTPTIEKSNITNGFTSGLFRNQSTPAHYYAYQNGNISWFQYYVMFQLFDHENHQANENYKSISQEQKKDTEKVMNKTNWGFIIFWSVIILIIIGAIYYYVRYYHKTY
jgi:cytoskeletal protein RodZ